ncbi:MAG: ABC transporter permease [Clostridia bacterium]|nr:ABC transporter permease [Clostridia bacterium]
MILLLQTAIRCSAAFIYGCLGEIVTEKSGHLNLGIPGIMCSGVAGGCLGVSVYMRSLQDPALASYIMIVLVGVLGAFLFAAALGAIYALLTVSLKCNQNITGLALTTFGGGFAQVVMDNFVKTSDSITRVNFSIASSKIASPLPFAENLGWFGQLFFSYGILVYLAIALAIVTAIIFNRTKIGLRLRAVGENPAAADAVGVRVNAYKYGAILIGAGIAGIGGFFYVMDVVQGLYESSGPIEAIGWLAIALVIFTLWKPNLAIIGSILFGALYMLPSFLDVPSQIVNALLTMVPYVATVVVLIVISVLDSKENQPPASLGLNYFREDR